MNHLKQIAARLPEYGLDAMLLNSEPGEYYAVGFHGEGNVVVTAQGCFYFTDSRYIEAANHLITGAEIAMTGRSRNYRAMVQEVVDRCCIRKLGFEEGYLSVADYNLWKEGLTAELVPAQKLVNSLRAAKDDGEIALMTKAQEITDRAFSEILKFIQPGMTEQEIAAKLQYDMLRFGAEKMSFDPIVVSGPNGSLPHGIPSAKQVQQGEFITMDFGCKYGGYCSDMTRTVALGEPTGEMQKVYQTVLEAQLAGIAVTKAGVPGKSIDAAARKVIEDAGYGEYFGHGYGHSLGIEIHESPNANTRDETLLPVGAVVSAEPGIYLPGKFGVRIEDVTVLTADGCMVLTKSPKELIIL
ncbi:peptidase M24 family protein [Flavonifractor plautii]|uniref:Aminopeptidase P family protein n=1 Tax=Flavonifractor plautii TaxID=292800 RepID=A0AAX1KHA0_FLAPL|nr:aminopeptidase P family protein [Flavonifractor plautii]ANU41860.1 Xaa-Pro dipeptidase [Flavonifractor plautii]OXE48891.1 peptidase M24 family protein [Flavonifractor plautii]QQR05262.1 aminopeptidase P family protein [Flavonifractor plautii]UQA26067.1 aminopeptidase P family protein [Flavonifractor plautii]